MNPIEKLVCCFPVVFIALLLGIMSNIIDSQASLLFHFIVDYVLCWIVLNWILKHLDNLQ